MSIGEVFSQATGPFGVIFVLLFFGVLILSNKLYLKREIDYREEIIDRLTQQLDKQQELFDGALELLKEQRVVR